MAWRPPTGKALTFKALRLQGFLESSGNRHFSFLLEETEGTAGIEVPPEKLQTDEATAATSSFFMPYAANDDDAASGVEAGIESDDSDDESDDDSDNAEEEDQGELQFLNMDRERPARLPPRLRPLGKEWRERNAKREFWVRSARELETKARSSRSTFRASEALPFCYQCDSPATVFCEDCTRGGRYACEDHNCTLMNDALIHNISSEDVSGGFIPRLLPKRVWRLDNCGQCLASLSSSTPPVPHSIAPIVLHTQRNGVVDVDVCALKCAACDSVSGIFAAEFDCTPGDRGMWVENSLLRVDRAMYKASSYALPLSARFNAKLDSDSKRGSYADSSSAAQVRYSDATRIFLTIENDLRELSTEGGNKPPIHGMMTCAACSGGFSLNVDACLKTRCTQFNSRSAAPPLPTHNDVLGPISIDSRKERSSRRKGG